MTETKLDAAVRAVAERRVNVIRANERGIALVFRSDKPDPQTLEPVTYQVRLYLDGNGALVRDCRCPAGQRWRTRCKHLLLAELLWRPGASR